MSKSISILSLDNQDARKFFLKSESYCNVLLPPYFYFDTLLQELDRYLENKDLYNICNKNKLISSSNVNYTLYTNKDGNLSWRPFQLINPIMYVAITHKITNNENWIKIQNIFKNFKKNKNIQCFSIPVQSKDRKSDKANQILTWWQKIEQESINLSLEYNYLFDTDIANCYGSVYTHAIAWAIEGKDFSKNNQQSKNLGNDLDRMIREMQNGQTNGIPQGSVLMDFIAEILLAYIDDLLSKSLVEQKIADYKILRHRDDYRIFVKSYDDGLQILKTLSEIMIPFGFRLNSSKTKGSKDIITQSIKSDKLSWIKQYINPKLYLQKYILIIRQHSIEFPNSGSITKELNKFDKIVEEIQDIEKMSGKKQLIAIIADIACNNPKTIPVCFSIISKLLNGETLDFLQKLFSKFSNQSNSAYAEIWLQRIFKNKIDDFQFKEKLCELPKNMKVEIWDNNWVTSKQINKIFKKNPIFNQNEFDKIDYVIRNDEVDEFNNQY